MTILREYAASSRANRENCDKRLISIVCLARDNDFSIRNFKEIRIVFIYNLKYYNLVMEIQV